MHGRSYALNKKYDITGKQFGYLTVIERDVKTIGERNAKWVCKCECGNYSIATYGDISMFSFHATKVFNTIEGGGLAFANSQLKQKAEALKNFGIIDYETTEYVGGNAKMNEFQAAMGLCNLEYLNRLTLRILSTFRSPYHYGLYVRS